jgi:hypothetical protein
MRKAWRYLSSRSSQQPAVAANHLLETDNRDCMSTADERGKPEELADDVDSGRPAAERRPKLSILKTEPVTRPHIASMGKKRARAKEVSVCACNCADGGNLATMLTRHKRQRAAHCHPSIQHIYIFIQDSHAPTIKQKISSIPACPTSVKMSDTSKHNMNKPDVSRIQSTQVRITSP